MAEIIQMRPRNPVNALQMFEELMLAMGRNSTSDVSDLDLARLAFRYIPMPVVYMEDSGEWAVCQPSGLWALDRKELVLQGFMTLSDKWRAAARQLRDAATAMQREDKEQAACWTKLAVECVNYAKKLESKWACENLLPLAADHIVKRVKRPDFDLNPVVVGLQNGAFDIQLGEFFTPIPDDLVSMVCAASFNPFAQCPTWLSVLDRITGNLGGGDKAEMLAYLQVIAGRCALWEVGGRMVVFFSGPPGSGKSVFLNTLKRILGDYAVAMSPMSLMASRHVGHGPRPDLLAMIGARMLQVPEVENTQTFDIAGIKRYSGGDPVTARDLHKGNVTFDVGGLICMTGNTSPRMPGISDSFMTRLRMVKFENQIPRDEQDVTVSDRLLAERDGIMSWILVGAMRYLRGEMVVPSRVMEHCQEFMNNADTIGMFVRECCEEGNNFHERREDFLRSYNNWAGSNGFRLYERNGTDFYLRMQELGFETKRPNGVRSFMGVKVRDEFCHDGYMPDSMRAHVRSSETPRAPDQDGGDGIPNYLL